MAQAWNAYSGLVGCLDWILRELFDAEVKKAFLWHIELKVLCLSFVGLDIQDLIASKVIVLTSWSEISCGKIVKKVLPRDDEASLQGYLWFDFLEGLDSIFIQEAKGTRPVALGSTSDCQVSFFFVVFYLCETLYNLITGWILKEAVSLDTWLILSLQNYLGVLGLAESCVLMNE